jgi:hypothetical protein
MSTVFVRSQTAGDAPGLLSQGADRLSAQIDRLFPAALAISDTLEFRDYAIEFTTRQFQISLWLAVFTNASFGLWDVFGQEGVSIDDEISLSCLFPLLGSICPRGWLAVRPHLS